MFPEIASLELRHAPELNKRQHAKAMREALKSAAVHHRDVTLGKHFKNVAETAPGGAYGYSKRSEKYTARKLKRFGHSRPNELTGRSKRFVRNNSSVTATQVRSRLRIRFPFPMNDQRRAEMEAITATEVAESQKLAGGVYAGGAKQVVTK